MSKNKIAICSCARLKSSRCKRKMIRPFNGSSLTDIMLRKLRLISSKNKEFDVFLLVMKKFFWRNQKGTEFLLFKEQKSQQTLMDLRLKYIIFLKI